MFSEADARNIRLCFAISGALGFFGSVFIIVSYLMFGKIRTYNKLLVVCLSIADVGKGISCMLSILYFLPGEDVSPPGQPTPLCFIQALGIQYFEISGFLWPGIIATHLYLAVCKKTPHASLRKLFPVHLAVGFGVPVLLVVGIVALNAIGNSNPEPTVTWCWVEGQHALIRLAFYYIPMVLLWCYNIALYWLISKEVGQIMSFAYRHVVTRLALYILILIVTDVPALVNRLQNIIDSRNPIVFLYYLHALAVPLQGFLNAIVYGLNQHLRAEYRACCGCSAKEKVTKDGGSYQQQADEEEDPDLQGAASYSYASGQTNSAGYGSTGNADGETFFVKVARFD